MWSVVFRFEVLTCKTFTVVLGICVGLLLASLGATDFSWRALVLILGASCLSGLRCVGTCQCRPPFSPWTSVCFGCLGQTT